MVKRKTITTLTKKTEEDFLDTLFPMGTPSPEEDEQRITDLYKMMVESSENLVARRQTVNTFFLTVNGALLTAIGLLVKGSGDTSLTAFGVAFLTITGGIFSFAWRSLIISFGQLNKGKFKVINTLESHLKASIYAAEWKALESGENPKTYRSFTSREIWVPNVLIALFVVATVIALLIGLKLISPFGTVVSK